MSDEVLKQKVQDLLTAIDTVFHKEWRKTKLNLDHEMIEHFIDPKGSFLDPEGPTTVIPWNSRDLLLAAYRSLQDEMGGGTSGSPLATDQVVQQPASPLSQAQPTEPSRSEPTDRDTQSYLDIVNGVGNDVPDPNKKVEAAIVEPEARVEPQVEPVPTPEPKVSNDVPEPAKPSMPSPELPPSEKTGSQAIPKPGAVQWPGPMTAPVGIQPAGATAPGFANPFAAAVAKKEPKAPAAMQGPDTGKPKVKADPAALRAIAAKEKFSHLIDGVQHEVIRDFILADGKNSGTGKPTVIIYTLEQIWLEFAFPYEEGQRILNKYPQRDAELIEFMKASGKSD
jgi:hypothetical protein